MTSSQCSGPTRLSRPARVPLRLTCWLTGLGLLLLLAAPAAEGVIDLRVGPLGWTAPLPGPVPGEQTPLVVTVINDGDEASPPVNVNIWKNWTQAAFPTSAAGSDMQQTVGPVQPFRLDVNNALKASFTVSYDQVGTYFLVVVIDVGNTVAEQTKDNNVYGFIINVVQANPDLIIESLVPSTTSFEAGRGFQVAVNVKNQGRTGAGPFSVAIFKNRDAAPADSSGNDGVLQVGGLNPGEVASVTFDVVYDAPGQYTLWALADSDASVAEPDDANNATGAVLTVVAPGGGGGGGNVPPPTPTPGGGGICGASGVDPVLPVLTLGLMLGLVSGRRLTRVQ